MPELSVIIVNYNTHELLHQCLESLYRCLGDLDSEIIVVDNASSDRSREMLEMQYPSVRKLFNQINVGFAAANNMAIREAKGEYILLLNPDTKVLDGAIQKTLQFMRQHPTRDIVGCKLLFPDGTVQRTVRGFPSVLNVFLESTFLYLLFPKSKIVGHYYMSYFDYNTFAEVDWILGAFMMIKKRVINAIGLLDEQFYMYTEEVDYCYRAKKAGFHVWYYPDAEVIHHWGGRIRTNTQTVLWTNGSQLLFFQKHFDGFEKVLLVTLKYFGVAIRVVVYFFLGCVSLNRGFLSKARYHFVATIKLLTQRWIYHRSSTAYVTPWNRIT